MNKIISFVLLCALLITCFSGCAISNDAKGDKEINQGESPDTNNTGGDMPVIIEGELDKSSDLVVTLVAYLDQYMTEYDLIGRTFAQKVDDIKNGIQPLHVVFDPSNYYFVCGYYNSPSEYGDIGYRSCNEYTWVGYKNESDVKEYYSDMKWAVVFQINRAIAVTDIVSNERQIPDIEHFRIIEPTFENGVNIADPVVFNETFIYLNYPNCYLNKFSQSTATMYYCKSIYYHSMNTIPCVCLDGEYYLYFYRYTVYADGRRAEEKDYTYTFGKYYDSLMSVLDKNSYGITEEQDRISYYGTVSFDFFINDVLK